MHKSLLLAILALASARAQNSTCSLAFSSLNRTDSTDDVPCSLQRFIYNITSQERFAQSTWSIGVRDLNSSELIVDVNAQKMMVTGSIMKVPTVATFLDKLGPEGRFNMTLESYGGINGSTLQGDLVLVAAGDFSFGFRESVYNNGSMFFSNSPLIDHNYADVDIRGTQAPPGDPFAGMKKLVAGLKGKNVTNVSGDVYVDTSLFNAFEGWPDGILSSIWFNENVIDINVTAPDTTSGQAQVSYQPKTDLWRVEANITIVADTPSDPVTVISTTPGVISLTGKLAAKSGLTGFIFQVPDPAAWARAGLLKVLKDEGITVQSANSSRNSPSLSTEGNRTTLATYTSAKFDQFSKVVLAVSYNRGAQLLSCLIAANGGSKNCPDGIPTIVDTMKSLGVATNSIYPFDPAGSDERDRGSPASFSLLLRGIRKANTPWSRAFYQSMTLLGVEGTEAQNQVNASVRGHARLKSGTRAGATPAGQPLLTALTLTGYLNCSSGREISLGVMLRDFPFSQVSDALTTSEIEGDIVNAIYEAF